MLGFFKGSSGTNSTPKSDTKISSKKIYKVLVSDPIDKLGIEILESVAEVDVKPKLSEDEICAIISDYDALMVRSGTNVTEKIIKASNKLRIIGRAGVGIDNVHVKSATEKGIFVVNSPQGNTVAAAEMTLALMLSLARQVSPADASMRKGEWNRACFMGSQLYKKTLGIVGMGQVGSHVAKVCREAGMELLVYDPFVSEAKAKSLDAKLVAIEEIWKNADFITLHVPLLPSTKNLVNEDAIKLMKPGCRLINCSRGGVVDETALCKALSENRIAGAALDVYEVEKAIAADSELLNVPNLLLTPHLGASTFEAQENVATDVAQQIKETLEGGMPQSAVNIPGMRASEMAEMMPLLRLADWLGQLAGGMVDGALVEVQAVQKGNYTHCRSQPLMLAAVKGVLSLHTDQPVNFVNVEYMSNRYNIKLTSSDEPTHVQPSLTIIVKTTTDTAQISGVVREEGGMLLTSWNGIPIYMITKNGSKATLVYSLHDDVPGTLSDLTGVLGKHKVNINDMHLGQDSPRTLGICVMNCTPTPPNEAIKDLEQLPFTRRVRVLNVK
eukprot:Platyproteum_vivax@DN14028_c0_g1_i1.p1